MAIVPQICEALQYAHDAHVVHRDIKPGNILIDALGRVKQVARLSQPRRRKGRQGAAEDSRATLAIVA